jgi:thymidylate synthase ThyX
MSEAEINKLFEVAMQKARESAQQEMRELVETSMAAAREEMKGVVRDSISIATPKIEIVEVVSPKVPAMKLTQKVTYGPKLNAPSLKLPRV